VRVKAGLPKGRIKGVMRSYWNSQDGVLCLFPKWFARKADDWPAQAVLTRFPLYDERKERGKNGDLESFLRAGEPPVVITPGSANAHGARFLRESAEACVRIGRRGIIVTRFPEQVPAGLPSTIRSFEYLPFSEVFPRSAAVIHHGGVGTVAQCFAGGVPQLIMPLSHDQPDNAARVKRMGVGDYMYPRRFRAANIAAKLGELLASRSVQEACAQVRRKIDRQMNDDEMGELIENLSERALRIRQINGAGVLC
jgi:UDP:flavonoid glycosyltransferase YjiC (YdhE family)